MKNGARYVVTTHWGTFSLDEGAYQDYLAGKLWISWKPGKSQVKPTADHVPVNVSKQALELRDIANSTGVFSAASHFRSDADPVVPNLQRMAECGIEELNLSVRASNGLMRAGLNTFGKLTSGIEQEGGLFKIRNLGQKSEKEIRIAYIEECYQRMLPYEKAEYWQSFLDQRGTQQREGVYSK